MVQMDHHEQVEERKEKGEEPIDMKKWDKDLAELFERSNQDHFSKDILLTKKEQNAGKKLA